MKTKKRFWVGVTLVAGIVLVALFSSFLWETPSSKFPGGRIYLTGARVGFTNEFKHGSRIETLLGNAIKTNGWKLGPWEVKRPQIQTFGSSTNAESLTVQLKITPHTTNDPAASIQYSDFDRNYRIVHWGDDGFLYTEEFPDHYFGKRRDGYFGYLQTSTYARTSGQIHLEVQNRESKDGEWSSIAHLTFPNPKQTKAQAWSTQQYPATNSFEEFIAVLGTIHVQEPRDNVTKYRDIWQHAVDIPFKFFVNGLAVTNWGAEQMAVYDASGNYNRFGASKSQANGWSVYRAWRSATPNTPWRLVGHFAPESEFVRSNVFALEIPIALPSTLVTNLGGLTTTIGFAGNMLQMRIPDDTSGQRLVLVNAFNERGESVKGWTGSWGQHGFMREIDTSNVKSNLTVIVAIVRNFHFEFVVQPILVKQLSPASEGLD